MKAITLIAAFFLLSPVTALATIETEEVSAAEQEYIDWARQIWESLEPQSGVIEIKQAGAVLKVPPEFYYLDAADSAKVLVEVWGNPPGQSILGMLFPADMTPFEAESWAVTIDYEEDGYVSDKDADDIDYADLLRQMQSDTAAESKARVEQGYESIQLMGWAAPPYYDAAQKKLHWAKEFRFGDQEINTLNYNIRILGRKGVLVLNFIAGIDQKAVIESSLDSVLALAEFEQGARYNDFDPNVDQVAAYGLGALVAGKVAAKTGILAAALLFLKKFGVVIVVSIGLFLRRLFSARKTA